MSENNIDVVEIAKWFIKNNHTVIGNTYDAHLKLQKLVYYSQAMYSAVFGEKLYEDKIEAWPNGPVVRSLYIEKRYSSNELNEIAYKQESLNLNDDIIRVLNTVNSVYGVLFSEDLTNLTHNEKPWKDLEEEANNKENYEIEFVEIKEYYKELKDLYFAYEDYDFSGEVIEIINGNIFSYNTAYHDITKKDLEEISSLDMGIEKSYTLGKVEEGLVILDA